MSDLKIHSLSIDEGYESFVPSDDVRFVATPSQSSHVPLDSPQTKLEQVEVEESSEFIDEAVVRQMILDENPDNLHRTGNPTLPLAQSGCASFHYHPLAFAG